MIVGGAVLLALAAIAVVFVAGGGEDTASGQTVRFQKPTDTGPDPFTKPSDVRGRDRVALIGQGPFGGTGSDLVCDRELLIRSLQARPERLREWARVLGVEPTPAAVAAYIRKLRPVTLTRDTRVTNHNFVDGRAVGYQAILQAGTAVLVDKDGKPVARCRCGNPLLEPTFVQVAKCYGCPRHYTPPPPCKYFDYDDREYDRFDDEAYRRSYDPRDYRDKCYAPYPNPPSVSSRRAGGGGASTSTATASGNPSASFSPPSGPPGTAFTLYVSGFSPSRTVDVSLVRPDGVRESYSITTDADGRGAHTFSGQTNVLHGTYTVTITDPATGRQAGATATVTGSDGERTAPAPPPHTTPREHETETSSHQGCPSGTTLDPASGRCEG